MTAFIALLRAVNVGGTGALPMTDLKAMCVELGFERVRTFIASGNVVFDSPLTEPKVKALLEAKLADYAGKPVGVMVRTGDEMVKVLRANPFRDKPGNRVMAVFIDEAPPADALEHIAGQDDEEVRAGVREFYVFYPQGQAKTKLRIPAAKAGTARNMNTVAKLVEMTEPKI
jgi:uncharacterized protein (DUF1697 family)